ncbi:hypothetical protein E2562_000143 [Oryza meyeriana var. granulata]|uniref:Uncharacterized protein n=1 Tax=Oryza meyeriana var. granulata TaxID=110450 RepID=A0A6G1DBS7_9ORYZ|nr:hypothetical protein E2562_000143 [Oryza meyeriana var. granulata]
MKRKARPLPTSATTEGRHPHSALKTSVLLSSSRTPQRRWHGHRHPPFVSRGALGVLAYGDAVTGASEAMEVAKSVLMRQAEARPARA